MIGLPQGLMAAEGERKRRGRFQDRNPGLITRPTLRPIAPASAFTVTVFTRKQTAAQGFFQMPAYQPATSHEPAANLTATVTDYGQPGKLVVPAGTMIDCIEIKVRGGKPVHPDFRNATGSFSDMRRHKSLHFYNYYGKNFHSDMARWYNPRDYDAEDIVSASGGYRFAYSWTTTRAWGTGSVISQPVLTLVEGGSSFHGWTYRIWDAYRGLTGWSRQGALDMYYKWRTGNVMQLRYWADDAYETDFLRYRTLQYDLRGSSYSSAYWYQHLHPRAVGHNYLSTGYNTATPRMVNFDLSPIEPGKRFVIQQEF